MDSRGIVDYVMQQAADTGLVRVLPIGAVTKGRAGKLLAEMGELADGGLHRLQRRRQPRRRRRHHAPRSRVRLDLRPADYRPLRGPAAGGRRHARRLGLGPPRPQGHPERFRREHGGARHLARPPDRIAHVHIAHLSTAGSVELVRRAKADGLRVTAEVTPHHVALNHEAVMWRNGDESLPRLRHEREDVPAAAASRGRCSLPRGPARRHDRRHRDGPRAARRTGEALRVRRGRERHHRPGDGAVAQPARRSRTGTARRSNDYRSRARPGPRRDGCPASVRSPPVRRPTSCCSTRSESGRSRLKRSPRRARTRRSWTRRCTGVIVATIYGGEVVYEAEGVTA